MEITAVVSRKGGVGKTATAYALGAGLRKRGKKVLFIDLDSQQNLSYGLGADLENHNSMEMLTGEVSAQNAIQETPEGDIIAASEALAGADMVLEGTGKEYKLKEALEGLQYDVIIIDTPASLGTLTVNAMTAADNVIIPVQTDISSIQGIGKLYSAINAVQKYCNKDLKIRGLLVTMYQGRAIISQDMQKSLQKVAEKIGTKLYSTPIRSCVAVREAHTCKQNIFDFAPKSNAAKDYETFLDEFTEN